MMHIVGNGEGMAFSSGSFSSSALSLNGADSPMKSVSLASVHSACDTVVWELGLPGESVRREWASLCHDSSLSFPARL